MNNQGRFFILFLFSALIAWGPALHADKGSEFGFLWGLSVPDAQNTKSFKVWGIKGNSFVAPWLSLGGYYMQSDRSGQLSSNQKFAYELTGVEPAYHIPSQTGDTFIALRMGMTKLQTNPALTDAVFSPYHYGLATGYDYYITTYLSIGFEGSYLHVLPGRTQINGTDYLTDSFNIINFLIILPPLAAVNSTFLKKSFLYFSVKV